MSFFKVKIVDKIKQSTCLCLILHVKHKASTTHKIYLILPKKIKGFPLKVKSIRITTTYQKLEGGGGQSSPLLYHGGDVTFRVRLRV